MNNCNMSVGFFFQIGKVSIYLRIFFNQCSKVCHFTNIEIKQNPIIISQLFILSAFENFFWNFNMTHSLGIMIEV